MRFHVRFDGAVRRFVVLDRAVGNEPVGLHADYDGALQHARAEEDLWRRYGEARKRARVYERQQPAPHYRTA